MRKCAGCAKEFDDAIELYPRLIFTKEARMARRLAAREGEEFLCLGCWLEAIEHCDNKDLAMLILGMLRKVSLLETNLEQLRSSKESILEKYRPPWSPSNPGIVTTSPYVVWTSDHSGDLSPNMRGPYCVSHAEHPKTNQTSYVTGIWAKCVGDR